VELRKVHHRRDGTIVARFLSGTEPDGEDLLALLQKELNKNN